jgi:hypothetical protein
MLVWMTGFTGALIGSGEAKQPFPLPPHVDTRRVPNAPSPTPSPFAQPHLVIDPARSCYGPGGAASTSVKMESMVSPFAVHPPLPPDPRAESAPSRARANRNQRPSCRSYTQHGESTAAATFLYRSYAGRGLAASRRPICSLAMLCQPLPCLKTLLPAVCAAALE